MLIKESTIAHATADVVLAAILVPWVMVFRGLIAGLCVATTIVMLFAYHRYEGHVERRRRADRTAVVAGPYVILAAILVPLVTVFHGWWSGLYFTAMIFVAYRIGIHFEQRIKNPDLPYGGMLGWTIRVAKRLPGISVVERSS